MQGAYRHKRIVRLLLVSLGLFLWVVLSLALAALLFHGGEALVYDLGPNYGRLNLEIALYHLREVSSDGDYALLVNDTWHYFAIIPIEERLGHAISSLFSLHWSYATSMNDMPLVMVVSTALRGSLLGLLFFALSCAIAFLFRFVPSFKVAKWVPISISLALVAAALLSPLWSSRLGWPIPLLSTAVFLNAGIRANKKGKVLDYLAYSFFLCGLAWTMLHIAGFYTAIGEGGYSLTCLLHQGIQGKDNHTYALATLLAMVLSALPFAIASYLYAARPQKAIDQEQRAF